MCCLPLCRLYAQQYATVFTVPSQYKSVIDKAVADTSRIMGIISDAKALEKNLVTDSAIILYRSALSQSIKSNYNDGIAYSLIGIGHFYVSKGEYDTGAIYFKQAEPYCKQAVFHRDLTALLYNNIGRSFTLQGEYGIGGDYFYKALEEFKTKNLHNAYLLSILYNNIGGLWMRQDQNDKALYYLRIGEKIARDNKEYVILAYIYGTMGGVYNQKKDTRLNLYYSEKGLELAKQCNEEEALQAAAINLGISYEKEDPAKALAYFHTALDYDNSAFYFSKIIPYIGIGETYYQNHNYALAEKSIDTAISKGKRFKMADVLKASHELLGQVYAGEGRYKQAFEEQEEYTQLSDSIFNAKKVALINQLDTRYRIAEKDEEIIRNNAKITQQKSIIREKNLWLMGISGLIILLAVLFITLYKNNLQRQRLQAEKIRNLQQQQDILQQKKEIDQLKAMVNGEEKERARLARELHDGIVAELSVVKMNFSALKSRYQILQFADDFTEAIQLLDDTSLELRKTAHNLMPEILLEHGLAEAVHAFCEKVNISSSLHVDFHLSGFLPRFDAVLELSLYRMIQELIQNVIKHAKATEAIVQFDCHDPLLIITIEDNGIGLNKEQLGSNPGAGLKNIMSRVKVLQGQFDLHSVADKGTSVYIEFDLVTLKNTAAAWA
jgi:two-component system, NarL family, sensor kinase